MSYPTRILDADQPSAYYDTHAETVDLRDWKILVVGQFKLVRNDDGQIEVELVEDEAGCECAV